MGLFSNLFHKKDKDSGKANDDIIVSSAPESIDDEEIVAAIVAAIAVKLGTNTDNFIVRNIKRTPELDSIWSLAGRMKLMR